MSEENQNEQRVDSIDPVPTNTELKEEAKEYAIPKVDAKIDPKAQLDYEVFSEEDKNDKSGITLAILADRIDKVEKSLDNLPNVAIGDTKDGSDWIQNIRAARFSVPYKDWFSRTVDRDSSMFKQAITSERGPLGISAPKFNDGVGGKLTGEAAVLRIRALSGLGSIVQVPLWHSGFWITFKAPSEGAMLELNRRLTEEKIRLGRSTYGLAFANNSVFFSGWVIDFALSHVYDTSLKPELNDNIRERISVLDIPLIVWGLACVVWPRGFPYARAIISNKEGEEQKIVREKINIAKCLWTDNRALTEWQISHMAGRHGRTMTIESLQRYKDEFIRGKGRSVSLSEDIELTLRVPNIEQYMTSGQKWVNNIVSMVDKAFGLPPSDDVRDSYIMEQGKATNMRQFAHWVENINAGGGIIDDVETLEQTFDALSTNDEFRDKFFEGIKSYIEDSTISVIATPTVDDEKGTLPRFPHLIPIDALSVFFILLVQKVQQIQSRD